MLPLVFLGGLLDGVGGGGTSDWSLRGLGAAVAVVVIVGLDSAVTHAGGSLLVQPEKTRKKCSVVKDALLAVGGRTRKKWIM